MPSVTGFHHLRIDETFTNKNLSHRSAITVFLNRMNANQGIIRQARLSRRLTAPKERSPESHRFKGDRALVSYFITLP
jgi:hypothetical protein